MELYLCILKLFLNKEHWNRYQTSIDEAYLKQNYPELLKLFHTLEKLHELIEKPSLVDFQASFRTQYPASDLKVFDPLFERLGSVEASEPQLVEYLSSVRTRQRAATLAFLALDVAEGKVGLEALTEEARNFSEEVLSKDVEKDEFVSDDIEVLYRDFLGKPGLNWRLASLRRALGPLRKGDLGFVFARPETGKTTFLASEVTHMASQADAPVLWINNEEQGAKVMMRCYQAALGVPEERIRGSFHKAREAFFERTKRNIRIVDEAGINRRRIERLCADLKPSLIVVDQLDKVGGFNADREDLLLGAIYQWARELAKRYAPVIGISQADGSGEGVKYLGMGNVANAKTSKQAEADWILGIGVSFDDEPNVRGFSICKNKLIGGEESVPEMRHGKWPVLIRADVARYEDLAYQ